MDLCGLQTDCDAHTFISRGSSLGGIIIPNCWPLFTKTKSACCYWRFRAWYLCCYLRCLKWIGADSRPVELKYYCTVLCSCAVFAVVGTWIAFRLFAAAVRFWYVAKLVRPGKWSAVDYGISVFIVAVVIMIIVLFFLNTQCPNQVYFWLVVA
jgi:hypothetical protein